jgi:hypothetical protein
VYTASRALVMPELADLLTGSAAPSHGVLVGGASRHQVAVHVIRDRSVLPTLGQMAQFAHLGYDDSAGPLAPYVYWWRDDRWDQVTDLDSDRTITARISAGFNTFSKKSPAYPLTVMPRSDEPIEGG